MTPECFQGWACSHADFSCTLVVYFQSSFPEKIIAAPFLQGHACPRWTRPLLAHQHSLSGWINCCAKWRKLCHTSPHQRLPHPSPPSLYFFPEQYDAGLGTEMFNGAQNEGGSTNGKRPCECTCVCAKPCQWHGPLRRWDMMEAALWLLSLPAGACCQRGLPTCSPSVLFSIRPCGVRPTPLTFGGFPSPQHHPA